VLIDIRFGISESIREHSRGEASQAERTLRAGAHKAIAADEVRTFDDDEVTAKPAEKKHARFKRFSISPNFKPLPPGRWLVQYLVPEKGLVQLFGERKKGKTFVVLDMALCTATGRSFHGYRVERGRVDLRHLGKAAPRDLRTVFWPGVRHNSVDPADLDGWFDVVPVRVGRGQRQGPQRLPRR